MLQPGVPIMSPRRVAHQPSAAIFGRETLLCQTVIRQAYILARLVSIELTEIPLQFYFPYLLASRTSYQHRSETKLLYVAV